MAPEIAIFLRFMSPETAIMALSIFLAAIAALYVTMSVGRSDGRSVGRMVSNEFQEVQKAYLSES